MNPSVTGSPADGCSIDVKRFYVPGVVVTADCPACNKTYTQDLSTDYLSYPVIGAPEDVTFWCDNCNADWTDKIVLKLSVEVCD